MGGILVRNLEALVAAGIDRDELELLAQYVRHLANLMGLPHWRFDVEVAEGDGTAHAEIFAAENRNKARICFYSRFFTEGPDEQRHTIVHELLHPQFAPCQGHVRTLSGPLGTILFDQFERAHNDRLECAVDAITDFLAPLLPRFDQWLATRPHLPGPGRIV
jgi:hypothetical protein